MRTVRLAVITAGLSQPSSSRLLADRLAQAATTALAGRDIAAEVAVVELREHARDLTNNLLTGFPAPRLAEVLTEITTADALIVVSPIFSGSYSGLFKTFFDVLDPTALEGKPVLLGATGGTARHSLALEYAIRPLFAYLKAAILPTAVFAAAEDWASDGILAERLTRAGEELAALLDIRSVPAAGSNGDGGAEVIAFEQLLGAVAGARHGR
jgi:FMN reductase